jgi:hypothetical protein
VANNRENTGKVGKGNPPKHTQFKPGNNANPKGRPPKLPELDVLMAEVLGEDKDGKTAAQAILAALRAKAAKGDIRAAEVLLNRAYGMPKQTVENKGEQTIKIVRKKDASD